VDGARLAVIGLGRGGTLAYLAGCASRRVAAVVDAGGSLVRGELSAAHPHEPLELALNLGAPLLVLLGQDDPSTPAPQAARIEQALSRAMRSFELERVAGCGLRFLDRAAPGYHPQAAARVRERIVRFLGSSLSPD
jgi:carboxymethylenebutenolidase